MLPFHESGVSLLCRQVSENVLYTNSNFETASYLTVLKGYQAAMPGFEYSPFWLQEPIVLRFGSLWMLQRCLFRKTNHFLRETLFLGQHCLHKYNLEVKVQTCESLDTIPCHCIHRHCVSIEFPNLYLSDAFLLVLIAAGQAVNFECAIKEGCPFKVKALKGH